MDSLKKSCTLLLFCPKNHQYAVVVHELWKSKISFEPIIKSKETSLHLHISVTFSVLVSLWNKNDVTTQLVEIIRRILIF